MNSPASGRIKHTRRRLVDGRRSKRRYEITLGARWKILHAEGVRDAGTGITINLSSGGVLLHADRQLPVGVRIELALTWPVLLRSVAPLQLMVRGEVVRVVGRAAAVRIGHYEFRTVSIVRTGCEPSGTGWIAAPPEE